MKDALRIGIFGAGYVGLVTAACFAAKGHDVVVYDQDNSKLQKIEQGITPFYEPGLSMLLSRVLQAGTLRCVRTPHDGLQQRDVVFIAVGTPQLSDGRPDMRNVREVAHLIGAAISHPAPVIVNKSTVPLTTSSLVLSLIQEHCDISISVASNPEFLREGHAIDDFMHPDRIVVGCMDERSKKVLQKLYASFDAPLVITDPKTAELIKYASNAFLAMKISFVNELARICEVQDCDINTLVHAVGGDPRIGPSFLESGIGFGGSCLPKDVNALHRMIEDTIGEDHFFAAVLEVNARQVTRFADRIEETTGPIQGKRIAVWGLSFKAETDDLRESPAIRLTKDLAARGALIRAHDPQAGISAAKLLEGDENIHVDENHMDAIDGADLLVIATSWQLYQDADFALCAKRMNRAFACVARSGFAVDPLERAGFTCLSVGRIPAIPNMSPCDTAISCVQ